MVWMRAAVIANLAILLLLISVSSYSESVGYATSCNAEGYSCIKVKRGQSWQSLFPDERERSIVMRLNHRSGQLYPGLRVLVPDDLDHADLIDYSPLPRMIEPPNEKMVVVDLTKHVWGAYDSDGTLIRWGPATGGKDYCPDIQMPCRTKPGSFRIYSLGNSNCVSSKLPVPEGGAPMPYCMFFNGGQALHGSPGGIIRGNASHGCVRMFVPDAEWLRYDFVEPPMASNDYRGTKVVVGYGDAKEDEDRTDDNNENNNNG